MIKRYLKILPMAVAGTMLATSFTSAASAQTLRWSDGGPNRGARAAGMQWVAEEITKRTNGKVKFEFHWAGALMKSKAAVKGVGKGSADVGTIIAAYTPKELSAYSVADLPFEVSDIWSTLRGTYEFASTNAELKKMFSDLGLVYITNITTSPGQLICTKTHVKTVADLKGVKLRATGFYGKVFKGLGANVVSMGQSKVYTALDSGVVDCNQNYMYAIPVFKQQEIAKKMTVMNWGQFLAFAIVMNKSVYDKLGADEQKAIHGVGSEFVDHYAEIMINMTAKSRAAIEAAGVDIHEMSKGEKGKLNNAAAPFIQDWVKRTNDNGLPGQKLFDDYGKLLAKYEGIRTAKGYPWKKN